MILEDPFMIDLLADLLAGLSLTRQRQPSPDGTWLTYWNSARPARELIDKEESRDYVTRLRANVPLHSRQTVLDFGCGSGEPACLLAPHVGRIVLWDAAVFAQERARVKTAGVPNAELIDLTDPDRDPVGMFDLIIANSVIQYMSGPELGVWMRRWAHMLAPDGTVVLSDVPRPASRFIVEMGEFLLFAKRRGILLEAIRHGFSDIVHYRSVRVARPLMRVERSAFEAMSTLAGLDFRWLDQNLTFRRHRLSLILHRPGTDRA